MTLGQRLRILLKSLLQLGLEPTLLYGIYQLGLHSGHYRRLDASLEEQAARVSGALRPVPDLPERQVLSRVLSRRARLALTREGEAVVRGRFRMFGAAYVPIRLAPQGSLQHWTAYELGKAAVPPPRGERAPSTRSQATGPSGQDLKYVWEPARFGWAFTLGRAYLLTGRETYAVAFWKYFEAFDRGNPPYLGPQWMNGQEVAIRLLALLWSAQVFAPAAASTAKRKGRLARSIAQHAARIPPTLVYARSQNNNHLVVEAAALYAAGGAFGHRPWQDLGWRHLNRALQRQISGDGEYIQHSTNYHRLMLQAALHADAVRRHIADNWPPPTRDALARASHWLFSMLDPTSGAVPNVGANDGALLLPLSSSDFSDFRPTVQAAARAFLRTGLTPGDWDELSVWLGLAPAPRTADSTVYLVDQLRGRRSWGYVRASSFKSRLGHMDQLHLDLWERGSNIAPDAGTYLYNADAPWDNPLVSTRMHNTVTVDGAEQMTRGGRFLTLDWFPAYSKQVLTPEAPFIARIVSHHDGYRRLGIRHERVCSVTADDRWQIRDDLVFTRPGTHRIRLHWLLLDGEWKIDASGEAVHLRWKTPGGWMLLKVTATGLTTRGLAVTLIRGGRRVYGHGEVRLFDGWRSITYGVKLPALSLAVEASSSQTCSLFSEFDLSR